MQRPVAVVLGAVAAGGLAFGVYLTQRDDRPASASGVVGSPATSADPAPARDSTAPFSAPPARPVLPRAAMKQGADSAPVAPSLTAGAGADPAGAAANDPKSNSAMPALLGGERRGVSAIKARPPRDKVVEKATSFDTLSGRRQQLRMNRAFEAGACRAPDMKQRLASMTTTEQTKLRARCAKAGVTLPPSEE